jgi:hypothetical protein
VAVLLISGELTGAGKLLSGGIDGTKQLHEAGLGPLPLLLSLLSECRSLPPARGPEWKLFPAGAPPGHEG